MKRVLAITACALALPGIAVAATRPYDTGAFEAVSVATGVNVDITVGSIRSVVAETTWGSFDDLRISVENGVLHIDRAPRSWLSTLFSGRRHYQVHVVTPALHSLAASSGSDVKVKGNLQGDFTITASSGSDVGVSEIRGGNVRATTSSGSDIDIAGSCLSLEINASSGSDLDAEELQCESVTLQISSGSDVSVTATKRVTGKASSGSDVTVHGRPAIVQVEKSSGADVAVRN
ncbi:MAG TPA: head GIN domain-containing protein [Steroidobacteraceae bacterium]|nr:head GIN domain-containing protein [Steroidobacteraceae bacterium]